MRDVKSADFKTGPRLSEKVDAKTLSLWNDHILYTPSKIAALFRRGFPKMTDHLGEAIEQDFACDSRDGILYITVRPKEIWYGRNYSYRPGGYKLEANYDVVNRRMDSVSNMKVNPEWQGQGAGKALIRGMMEMAMALKFPRFDFGMGGAGAYTLTRKGGNGAYTWSRMGAKIDIHAPYNEYQLSEARRLIARRLHAVKSVISIADFHRAAELGELKHDDDLANLVTEMKDVFLPRELMISPKEIDEDSPIKCAIEKYISKDQLPTELYHISEAFLHAADKDDHGPNLPSYVMSGLQYDHAYVDFADSAQMKKVGSYIGGWKTIGPTQGQPVETFEAIPA